MPKGLLVSSLVLFKRAYEDRSQSPMWAYMLEYFVRRYTVLFEGLAGDEPHTQAAYSIRLYCYGTLGMTREWLLEDNITPAEVAVQMMFASMPQMLKRIYFGSDG